MSSDLDFKLAGFNYSDSESIDDFLGSLETYIIYDDLDAVQEVFIKNPDLDINKQYEDGNTLLHWACQVDSLDIVKFLIKHGANINIKNDYGNIPIQEALESESEYTVKYFIKKRFNLAEIKSFFYLANNKIFNLIKENHISSLIFYIKFGSLIKPQHVKYALFCKNIIIYQLLKKACLEPVFYSYTMYDKPYWP
jgi:ankyrin repeat protein